jgi:hypothetical protein
LDTNAETFWHGSPYEIALGDYLVPGCQLGRDRFFMDRNLTVFITNVRATAIAMGASLDSDGQDSSRYARWLYTVVPFGLYPDDDSVVPHRHICTGERQCLKAQVVARYKCQNTYEESWLNGARYDLIDVLHAAS